MPKVKTERLNYKKGWQRLFYITENGEAINPPPSVHCYSPRKIRIVYNSLKSFEIGVYYFDFYFKYFGEYVFIYFEKKKNKWEATTIVIITIER